MFASIMDGMKAQRERSTTNRREAAKLFNEHLKNQSDLGIEVTEQSLADAWDSNSGGVMRKHAPTQQRLQSIVTAQNKSLAEKQRASDFQASVDQRTLYGYVETDINKAIKQNRFSANPMNNADLYESLTSQYPEDSLQFQELASQTRNGLALGDMQSLQDSDALSEYSLELGKQVDKGYTNAEDLKAIFPSLSLNQIKAYVAKYQKGVDRSDVLEGREDIKFEQGQEDRVTNLAREIVEQAQADSNFKLNTAQLEAALLQAKVAVKRLVVTNSQDDATFAQNFEANVVAAATLAKQTINAEIDRIRDMSAEDLAAAQLKITNKQGNAEAVYNFGQTKVVDSQELKVFNQDQAKQPAIDLQSAKKDIDDNYTTATIETVTADLSRWGLTDPAIITQTWNQVRKKQEVFDLTGMTANNNSVKEKLITATSKNQKRVADFKVMTNSSLLANFKSVPADYHPEINAVAQRHIIGSDTVMPMRDWITKQIESGAWDDTNAVQRQSALYTWLESTGTPTYSSQMAQLQANSRSLAGVTQYTPARFKEVYISAFQTDAEYAIAQMENASQSNNVAGYNSAKASLAVLLTETQQDLLARKNNPQKAFGMRASQEEMSAATTDLGQLLKTIIDASEGIEVPVEKDEVDKGLRYEPVLFTPDFGSSSRIRSVDDALSYLANRTGGRAFSASGLSALQDDYTNLISSHEANKEELKKLENTNNVTEKLRLDKLLVENLNKLHEIHFEVKQIIRKVIADSERVGFI
jgi:hypothetical protein